MNDPHLPLDRRGGWSQHALEDRKAVWASSGRPRTLHPKALPRAARGEQNLKRSSPGG
jgi:hypothetical protein